MSNREPLYARDVTCCFGHPLVDVAGDYQLWPLELDFKTALVQARCAVNHFVCIDAWTLGVSVRTYAIERREVPGAEVGDVVVLREVARADS